VQEEQEEEEVVTDDEDDEFKAPSNPKNLPLGWDGKPIPYWLYKVRPTRSFGFGLWVLGGGGVLRRAVPQQQGWMAHVVQNCDYVTRGKTSGRLL
jgi:hypothetical protein